MFLREHQGRLDETDGAGPNGIIMTETDRAKAAAIRETMEETGLNISEMDMATLS